MKVGESLIHPKWGQGKVLLVYTKGGRSFAKVKFAFATDSILLEEIEGHPNPSKAPESAPNKGKANRGQISSRTSQAPEVVNARKGVQSLRLGQITESHVGELSVGTNDFLLRADAAIESARKGQPQLLMIEGAWGTGKTHLLTLLAARANESGFAVSTTILDGYLYSLTDPLRLLESITSQMKFPKDVFPAGAASRLKVVFAEGKRELKSLGGERINKIISTISSALIDDGEAVAILEDYMGLTLTPAAAKQKLSDLGYRYLQLPALRAKARDERGARFVELLNDWAAYSVAGGSKGLLVILDELDVEYSRVRYGSDRARRDELLRALGGINSDSSRLIVAFASAPSGDEDHSNDAVADVIKKAGVQLHEKAVKIENKDLMELGKRIYSMYGKAYPGFSNKLGAAGHTEICRKLVRRYNAEFSPVPRRFIRSLLHCFDMIDLKQKSLEQVLESLA